MKSGAFRFRILGDGESATWDSLTFPAYRTLRRGPEGAVVRVGVSLVERPVGLGIARIQAGTGAGQVLSVAVTPSLRGQGTGTAILARLEQELQAAGCHWAEMVFSGSSPSSAALRRMLAKRGWRTPWPRMIVGYSTIGALMQGSWIGRTSLPAPLECVLWNDLNSDRKQAILDRQRASSWYPEELSPFREEHLIEPGNSLAAMLGGDVVGWMITHRVAPDLIRYGSLFLREDVRTLASAMALPARALELHSRFLGHVPRATCNCEVSNSPMVRFYRRRISPWATTYTTFASCRLFD